MLWPRIAYSIEPSFEDGSLCEFNPKGEDGTYMVHIQVRYAQRQIRLSSEQMASIVRAVSDLRLPPAAGGDGLDGTIYSLTVGTLNSIKYSWWETIPDEWAALLPIIAEIERQTDLRNENAYLGL
jgi:hypothetical protein